MREYNQFWESQQQHAVPRANHTIKNHVDDDDKHRIDAISLLELYVCECVRERLYSDLTDYVRVCVRVCLNVCRDIFIHIRAQCMCNAMIAHTCV